jgi:diaminopimelate decarboxylase
VESIAELCEINRIAKTYGMTAQVALRLNPDVNAVTHAAITTGTLKNKFGIDLATAKDILINRNRYANLKINGLHVHIGSQITTAAPYVRALKKVIAFKKDLDAKGITLEYLDIGGGMAADYVDGTAQPAEAFAKALVPLLKKINLKIIMEPGRFIVANAGIFVTKVLYLKDNGVKKFLIVDGAMNDLIRPSLYDSFHQIIPVARSTSKMVAVDVVGPICESGDYLGKDRKLPRLAPGNLLAVLTTGAYGYAMSSNYNARCRAAEVMVKENKFAIVKNRETFNDLIRGEHTPGFIL